MLLDPLRILGSPEIMEIAVIADIARHRRQRENPRCLPTP
jgi:hypothetical protein